MPLPRTSQSTFCHLKICLTTLLLWPLLLCACSGNNNPPSTTLTLLHSNDTHSQLESFSPYAEPEQGGVARRKTLIEAIRAEVGAERVLLVDAGDFSQGTIFYNAWQGSADIMALNALGYDVCTLGNHEFDFGPASLGRALRGEAIEIAGQLYTSEALNAAVVTTNLDVCAEPALRGLTQSSVLVDKADSTIGVLGMVTQTLSSIANTGSSLVVKDALTSLQAEIDALSAQGINKIIVLSHAGYAVDRHHASQLSGVDIIVSAHDHPLLLNAEDVRAGSALEFLAAKAVGPYPTVTEDADGHPLLIVAAYEWGKILGRLDVTFDHDGIISAWHGTPLLVDATIAADDALSEKVARYKEPIAPFSSVVIAETDIFYDGSRYPGLRSQEMPLGNLVADAILDNAARYHQAVAAIINGGSIRASLPNSYDPQRDVPPFAISYGEALSVLPFGNTISVVNVSGRQLVAALDNGLSWAYDEESGTSRSSGAFPQIAGLELNYCRATANDRYADCPDPAPCPQALLAGGVVTTLHIAGQPVDLNGHYRIASNDFLVSGGDFYQPLADACTAPDGDCLDSGVLLIDALVDYLKQGGGQPDDSQPRISAE